MPLVITDTPYGLALPIGDHPTRTPAAMRPVEDAKWAEIALTVGTPPGSRLMRRKQGGVAYDRLFAVSNTARDTTTAVMVHGEVTAAVAGVKIDAIRVLSDPKAPTCQIRFHVPGSRSVQTRDLNLERAALLNRA